jgi:hypothetical protein
VHLVTAETSEDGRASLALEVDEALDELALAQTTSNETFAEVLHSAHPVTSSGGMVIGLVGDLDEDQSRRLASLRQPGGTGIALVVDPSAFSGRRIGRTEQKSTELACIPVLRTAGWSVAPIGPQDGIPAVWGALTGSHRGAGVR